MRIVMYGIPNCDTVKKARAWLDEHGIAYEFHDFKKHGVPAQQLDDWVAQLGCERLVNRQGSTWRKLAPAAQAELKGAGSAKKLMQIQPSVIKRPVVEWDGNATVGFDPAAWALLHGA